MQRLIADSSCSNAFSIMTRCLDGDLPHKDDNMRIMTAEPPSGKTALSIFKQFPGQLS